jgi:hypothetical protein
MLSLPVLAVSGEDPGQLLAQPVLHAEPTSVTGCRSDPWDASRQVALPLAYSGGHPHDICYKKMKLQSNFKLPKVV